MALDVLTGVASEYLLNVGRTIQFLSDKYGKKMSPEVGWGVPRRVPSYSLRLTGNHSAYTV